MNYQEYQRQQQEKRLSEYKQKYANEIYDILQKLKSLIEKDPYKVYFRMPLRWRRAERRKPGFITALDAVLYEHGMVLDLRTIGTTFIWPSRDQYRDYHLDMF